MKNILHMEKMKRKIKYFIFLVLGLVILSQSVYIKKLDKMKENAKSDVFDAQIYVQNFWDKELPSVLGQAVDANVLLPLFQNDMDKAVSKYAKTLGIASKHAYLIKGEGTVVKIEPSGFYLDTTKDGNPDVLLIALDLFGNAVRDASGLVDVSDFPNSMEFNAISSEINKRVRELVVNPAKSQLQTGHSVSFIGAAEVSQDDPEIDPLGIIPIKIISGSHE